MTLDRLARRADGVTQPAFEARQRPPMFGRAAWRRRRMSSPDATRSSRAGELRDMAARRNRGAESRRANRASAKVATPLPPGEQRIDVTVVAAANSLPWAPVTRWGEPHRAHRRLVPESPRGAACRPARPDRRDHLRRARPRRGWARRRQPVHRGPTYCFHDGGVRVAENGRPPPEPGRRTPSRRRRRRQALATDHESGHPPTAPKGTDLHPAWCAAPPARAQTAQRKPGLSSGGTTPISPPPGRRPAPWRLGS